jgi:starch synthase
MKILHVAAECFPYVKTGGLADVIGALPYALQQAGEDVRLLLPGYTNVLQLLENTQVVCELGAIFGAGKVTLTKGNFPQQTMTIYVVDAPLYFQRSGNPYHDQNGKEWSDNAQRFALLSWVAAHISFGELDDQWCPEIMHAHDWHTGLACAYVAAHPVPTVKTIFTVHNLAYQGLFDTSDFQHLGLASAFANVEAMEFYGKISFMKAGLIFAHQVTTVSPNYAVEITTPEFGCGLDGVIRSLAQPVTGILNGVDVAVWNPNDDVLIPASFNLKQLRGKASCKQSLQKQLGLKVDPKALLFGIVSRLTQQKGLDLVLQALPWIIESGAQFVLQGSGDIDLERAFLEAARNHPKQIAIRIGYDEAFAHNVMAGIDSILVPSRFEPGGLTQLYGLRYGVPPIVRKVGGLANTVVDNSESELGTGFVFEQATSEALVHTMQRAADLYQTPKLWKALIERAMQQEFSWLHSAQNYQRLYRSVH